MFVSSRLVRKSPANSLFPFEVIPSVLGHSVNFSITKISIEAAPVSRLFPYLVTTVILTNISNYGNKYKRLFLSDIRLVCTLLYPINFNLSLSDEALK